MRFCPCGGALPVVFVGFRLVVGDGDGIGAGEPAVEVDVAAAAGTEGIMLA